MLHSQWCLYRLCRTITCRQMRYRRMDKAETESNCSMEDAMTIIETVLRRNWKKVDIVDMPECQPDQEEAIG